MLLGLPEQEPEQEQRQPEPEQRQPERVRRLLAALPERGRARRPVAEAEAAVELQFAPELPTPKATPPTKSTTVLPVSSFLVFPRLCARHLWRQAPLSIILWARVEKCRKPGF